MIRLAPGEYEMLVVASGLAGQRSADEVAAQVKVRRAPLDKMGPTAMGALERTLARGAVLQLAKRGGWRRLRFSQAQGRLWERHPNLALRFSEFTFELCRSLACEALPDAIPSPCKTNGDHLMAYLAIDLAQAIGPGPHDAWLRASPLAWLAYPDVVGEQGPPDDLAFESIVGADCFVIEALTTELAAHFVRVERTKSAIQSPAKMLELGTGQHRVLNQFLDAADAAGRRDLARFLVDGASILCTSNIQPDFWVGSLDASSTLSMRQRAAQAASAGLIAIQRVGSWWQQARLVGFVDDDYEQAQRLLSCWDHFGLDGFRKVGELLHLLASPTRVSSDPSTTSPEPTAAQRGLS